MRSISFFFFSDKVLPQQCRSNYKLWSIIFIAVILAAVILALVIIVANKGDNPSDNIYKKGKTKGISGYSRTYSINRDCKEYNETKCPSVRPSLIFHNFDFFSETVERN